MRTLLAWGLVWALMIVPATARADMSGPSPVSTVPPVSTVSTAASGVRSGWQWPLTGLSVVEPFVAPAHKYGPGHRGVDLRPRDAAAVLHAPASGVVAFAGPVAGRGILTIDHGDGLVTTLEPVSDAVPAGTAVSAGDPVATIAVGGHAAPGAVHFGVRLHGEYINPMLLLGGVPRAVLLPCC